MIQVSGSCNKRQAAQVVRSIYVQNAIIVLPYPSLFTIYYKVFELGLALWIRTGRYLSPR